jgi:hypothetical protein
MPVGSFGSLKIMVKFVEPIKTNPLIMDLKTVRNMGKTLITSGIYLICKNINRIINLN